MEDHKLGVSGSTILSNSDHLMELFWEGIDYIEIGEFSDEEALHTFLDLSKQHQIPFGVHAPLFRGGSKNDLIHPVKYDPDNAWAQLEKEAAQCSAVGADYILVHFPFFKEKVENANELIEEGLQKLSHLQQQYGIPFICEPKLGIGRSPLGIQYLHEFPLEVWEKYELKLCIDIGDYLLAVQDQTLAYLKKWERYIKTVHLHNVHIEGNDYFWIPVHPSHEENGIQYKIQPFIEFFSHMEDIIYVFEHTPHCRPSKQFVDEGYRWIRSLLEINKIDGADQCCDTIYKSR